MHNSSSPRTNVKLFKPPNECTILQGRYGSWPSQRPPYRTLLTYPSFRACTQHTWNRCPFWGHRSGKGSVLRSERLSEPPPRAPVRAPLKAPRVLLRVLCRQGVIVVCFVCSFVGRPSFVCVCVCVFLFYCNFVLFPCYVFFPFL